MRMKHMERGGTHWVMIGLLLANILVSWPHVFAQEGYQSLACGRTSSFTDATTGIHWIPDDNYTSTGIAWNDSSISPWNDGSIINTLRYFPTGDKNCYTLHVRAGSRYLIKGTHQYLNHDGKNRPPEFDVAIDTTVVFSVRNYYGTDRHEVIVTARRPYLNYCLLTRDGFPVISSLEIRPLPDSSFADASHGSLALMSQIDISTDVGPQVDFLDCVDCRLISWGTMIPNYFLRSEWTADATAQRLEFIPTGYMEDSLIIIFLYFAEQSSTMESTKTGDMILNITLNGELLGQYDVVGSEPLLFSAASGNPALKVVIEAAETSRKPPHVAVYRFIPTVEITQDSDVETLMSIKKHLNVVEWSGDPCLPVPWEGVTCEMQSEGLFVTGLDLSGRNVTSLVHDDIRRLSYLKQLRIDTDEQVVEKFADEYTENLKYMLLGRRFLGDSSNSTTSHSSKGSNNLLKLFIGIAVGVTCLLTLFLIIVTVYCYRRRQAKAPPPSPSWTGDLSNGPNYVMKSPLQDPKVLEMLANRPQELSLKEVQTVTEKFKSKIGEGGFGAVYYGTLPNGTAVAVKVRSLNSNQGTKEFTTELELLQKIKHENLVPLVGFCTEMKQEILIYPYMSNGSLHDRLYDKSVGRKPLDWMTRLDIVLGAARGINFLHTGGDRCVIHRDVKSSNILLDDSMKAKIADFGLSKVSPLEDESLVSTEVRGTAEYLDPEYYQTHQLTEMSDVYSFGIVLLETVCGREPLNMNRPYDERSLLEWVRPFIKDANIQRIVDPEIQTYTPESLWRVLEIALQSVETHSSRRPTIADIVREIEDALIIETNASQYMASIQSLDSLCIPPNIDLKDFSKKQPMPYPFPLSSPFELSPVFSDTMNTAPDPR